MSADRTDEASTEPSSADEATPEASSTVPTSTVPTSTETSGDTSEAQPVDGLVSQLRVIEDQPLDSRAEAFAQLHDRLQATLEGEDTAHRHA